VAIRFFDERRVRSTRLAAPLRINSSEWQRVTSSILVPNWSREAILQIGLMGATGQIEVDQIEIMPADRS
jgi:hypothetical protein